ncbi:hypothetical protein PUMCH_004887 [Australozyma saopauloensis]|uniref:Uncharacterized protein n=1 Tax=Australozyma saopauloensis TaxID=291208 RepID=A0AAX4HG69_9ASCO|nr:hypothetical protein PUMCH_004887 [[Candida] saopauloensis]
MQWISTLVNLFPKHWAKSLPAEDLSAESEINEGTDVGTCTGTPENINEDVSKEAFDLEEGFQSVQVNIHGALIVFKFMMIRIVWYACFDNAMRILNADDRSQFVESTQAFQLVVFNGFRLLVSLHEEIMRTIRCMALGLMHPTSYCAEMIMSYHSLRDEINSFASIEYPDNAWGAQASHLRNEVIRKFNEDTQLVIYYCGYMIPSFWEMAIARLKLHMELAWEKVGTLYCFVFTLLWVLLTIPTELVSSALEIATTSLSQNMAVSDLEPPFMYYRTVPWENWTSTQTLWMCLVSGLALLLLTTLILLFVKPAFFQRIKNSFSKTTRTAYARWKSIGKSLEGPWPKDISKEDFASVGAYRPSVVGIHLESVYKARLDEVEINTCWVTVPVEDVYSDDPPPMRRAPPGLQTQAHTTEP